MNDLIIIYGNQVWNQYICVLLLITLPRQGLTRITEQAQVLVAQKNAFLIINFFACGNYGLSGELITASKMHC